MDMQKNIRVNREHKDSLFRFIFRSVYKELHADRETGC